MIIILVASFSIVSNLIVMVVERAGEIAILKSARDNPSAADWVALVTGPVGQAVLRDAGFGPAQSSGLADG